MVRWKVCDAAIAAGQLRAHSEATLKPCNIGVGVITK